LLVTGVRHDFNAPIDALLTTPSDATLYRDSMYAHAALGKAFPELPVVLTTSAEVGPNGPLPQEILDMYPNAPLIKRFVIFISALRSTWKGTDSKHHKQPG
jgi:hypothetical protein